MGSDALGEGAASHLNLGIGGGPAVRAGEHLVEVGRSSRAR